MQGPVAREQLKLFYVTCWVTLVIFIIVACVLAYATVKFRARTEADEHAEPPPQGHGNPLVEVGLIGGSVLALVIIAIPTLKAIWYTYDVPVESKADSYEVTATGYQWWFKFVYPSEQIPGAGTLTTGNELVIPARPPRPHQSAVDGRDAQLLGSEIGRQGGHDPEPSESSLARVRQTGLFLGPMRGVLRRVPCCHVASA